jgi:hypothetical protein
MHVADCLRSSAPLPRSATTHLSILFPGPSRFPATSTCGLSVLSNAPPSCVLGRSLIEWTITSYGLQVCGTPLVCGPPWNWDLGRSACIADAGAEIANPRDEAPLEHVPVLPGGRPQCAGAAPFRVRQKLTPCPLQSAVRLRFAQSTVQWCRCADGGRFFAHLMETDIPEIPQGAMRCAFFYAVRATGYGLTRPLTISRMQETPAVYQRRGDRVV